MSARRQLRRLGQLYGIDASYSDIWGRRHRVAVATERALLEAMGAAVGSAREIADSLREAEARPWRRMLAPVKVVAPPEPLELTFTLPVRLGNQALDWTLREETGALHEGALDPDQLPAVGAAAVDGEAYRRWRMPLPPGLPHGYHQLSMAVRGRPRTGGSVQLIVTPARGHELPPGARFWGFGAQLYGVRSARNWGMGDFTDLANLAELAAALGAGAVGINPLHALFPADPNHISPYSPSSRLFLNVLYLDPEAAPELEASAPARALLAEPGLAAELNRARAAELVDYPAVWRLKLQVLELLFKAFRAELGSMSDRARAFLDFAAAMGAPLERHAVFDALHEHMLRTTGAWSWHDWPEPYRHPDHCAVAAFAREHRDRVDFFIYLQWLADRQLAAVQRRARAAGMPIGLYHDIAVAVNPASAMTWAHPEVSLSGVTAGAPPDWFNPKGQNWVLAPLSPIGLRENAYAVFAAALRHNMRYAGAVRVDHVMGLKRLFWIPDGAAPAEGAYVRYPFKDLVSIVALESQRHRCLVIGEDLGTVPRGFRSAMQRAGLLSCRVLYFERGQGGAFLPPPAYPRRALVSASTHDLPTLKGYWTGRDLKWQDVLRRFPGTDALKHAQRERARDRVLLLRALEGAGLLPAGVDPERPPVDLCHELIVAIHRYLAMTPGHLLMVQLEDALGEEEQPNLPGADEHPNWRRKLGRPLEELADLPLVRQIAGAMAAAGRAPPR